MALCARARVLALPLSFLTFRLSPFLSFSLSFSFFLLLNVFFLSFFPFFFSFSLSSLFRTCALYRSTRLGWVRMAGETRPYGTAVGFKEFTGQGKHEQDRDDSESDEKTRPD
ncbi:hypothetical protein P167DRAFT_198073 [Morchella conica CCBAS932]|uniref:Transmembrane protein n=1 Tax=Morchella conica CCBAS932 TaxID=1392247 RepID=A0A3N4L252_9PEZI|nr:hypothetical protein P167DRAFT_198073 [Morchella conica CCBAS932]